MQAVCLSDWEAVVGLRQDERAAPPIQHLRKGSSAQECAVVRHGDHRSVEPSLLRPYDAATKPPVDPDRASEVRLAKACR